MVYCVCRPVRITAYIEGVSDWWIHPSLLTMQPSLFTASGDGWFLERVAIKDHKGSGLESVFPCHHWLDAALDEDGKTSREIYVNNKPTNRESTRFREGGHDWKLNKNKNLERLQSKRKGTKPEAQIC